MTTPQDTTNTTERAPRSSGSPPDGPRRAPGPERQNPMPPGRTWLWSPAPRPPDLPVERVRSRVGAYVYGNILVLAAIVATSPESIANWTGVVIVVATSATTFLAHVVAHNIGEAIGHIDDEDLRLRLARMARDAVPIMSSGIGPAVLLALGAIGWLSPGLSQLLAEAFVVLRLAMTGIVARRVSGSASPLAGLWSGFALAGISVVIAALKEILTN